RFPAVPEPPSLAGTGPGMWRISFSVPAALAPELGVRAWLQFGSVAVPLPAAGEFPGAGAAEEEPPEAEAALSELTKLVQRLKGEPAEARSRADELVASLAAQQINRRGAEQREHA